MTHSSVGLVRTASLKGKAKIGSMALPKTMQPIFLTCDADEDIILAGNNDILTGGQGADTFIIHLGARCQT